MQFQWIWTGRSPMGTKYGARLLLSGGLVGAIALSTPLTPLPASAQLPPSKGSCELSADLEPHRATAPPPDPAWETPRSIIRSEYGAKQRGHTHVVTSVAFSPDGRFLLSGSRDKTLKIWDLQTKRLERTLANSTAGIATVAFSPDGQFFADGNLNGTVRLWTWAGKEWVGKVAQQVSSLAIAFSPDSRHLVSTGGADKTLRLWSIQNRQLLTQWHRQDNYWVGAVAFSANGKLLASGGLGQTVDLWDAATGQRLCTVGSHAQDVTAVAFSPDGRLLASASQDATIKLWSLPTGRLVRTLTRHRGRVNAIAFSPSSQLLVSGGQDETVRLWRVQDGTLLRNPFQKNTDKVLSVAFRGDGQAFATGSADNTVQVFTYAPEYTASGNRLSFLK